MPVNQEILNLSRNIMSVRGADASSLENQKFQFKASKQRLTREELMGMEEICDVP